MIILGVDPGLANCGWGVIQVNQLSKSNCQFLDCGVIVTKNLKKARLQSRQENLKNITSMQELRQVGDITTRIGQISAELAEVVAKFAVDTIAIEKLFVFKNQKSVMEVAQVIGAVKAMAAEKNIQVFEYTPLQAKMALTGYGRADKEQMEKMVRRFLGLTNPISPSHASDAVAMALTHLQSKNNL